MSQPAPHNSPGPFTGYTIHRITEEVKGSYSDRKRTLKWVLLVTVPRTVLDATASLRTASVRQDQRQYCVLVLRTHPVGAEKVFFTNVAILRRTGIDRLHVAVTNPSHQRCCAVLTRSANAA